VPNRRQFLANLASATVAANVLQSVPVNASEIENKIEQRSKNKIHLDALCYHENLSSQAIENAVGGGLTAAVFDIAAYPREYPNAVRELARWSERFNETGGKVIQVRKAEDFERAAREEKLGVVLACQDASILGSSLGDWKNNLRLFHTLGLRVLQITHNNRTHWGDSFMEKRDGGLSRAGEELISEMNRLGMIVDLSHCSPRTLLDAVQVSKQPCAVTHTGCKSLAPTARNKSDEEIRALGKNGGFFGVFNMTTWLTDKPSASLDTVIEHIDHAAQLIGATQIGFGSDGALDQLDAQAETARMARVQKINPGKPSFEWEVRHSRVPELNAPNRLSALAEALARHGYPNDRIEGIVGGNFVRQFQKVCG
jgi:membrane dipeptidase